MERDGVTSSLQDVGAVVLANACGPCIGQVSNLPYLLKILIPFRSVETRRCQGGREWYVHSHNLSSSIHLPVAILTSFNRCAPIFVIFHLAYNFGQ